jgi:hypothetical protein
LPILIGALLVQGAIFSPILGRNDLIHRTGPYLHIGTLLATLVVIVRNSAVPGMKMVALGAALNALVVIANGGSMPTDPRAIRLAHREDDPAFRRIESMAHDDVLSNTNIADDKTQLLILGDAIPIPGPAPLATVISIGDLVITLGASLVIIRAMHRRSDEDRGPEVADTDGETVDPDSMTV